MVMMEAIYKFKYFIIFRLKNTGKMARTQGKRREFGINWNVAILKMLLRQKLPLENRIYGDVNDPFSHGTTFSQIDGSSVEVRVLCQGGGGGGGKSSLIGQKCKMVDGKQSSDWTIIQDGNLACDWTRIQDGGWNRTGLNKMKFSDWPKFKFKFSLM